MHGLTPLKVAVWYLLMVIVVIANALWFRAKFLLRARGFPVSWIWHFSDLPNLIDFGIVRTIRRCAAVTFGYWWLFTRLSRYS